MAKRKPVKSLTRAEEQVMQIIWDLEQAFVKDILEKLPPPRPAYNTVSTIVRILEQKGFVGYEAFGRSHRYHALIAKEAYTIRETDRLLENYFDNSMESMLSFFVNRKKLDIDDLNEVLKTLKKRDS